MAELKTLSYSQLATYTECPQRWYLQRRARVPDPTWYATLLGSAVHEVTEAADLLEWNGMGMDDEEVVAMFGTHFDAQLAEAAETGREIRASGKLQKSVTENGGPDKKDEEWCRQYGPIYVQRFLNWKRSNGMRIASIGGKPGIEIAFEFDIVAPHSGQIIPIRGFIDRVYSMRIGRRTVVVDLKTGRLPDTPLQLATYGVGLQQGYGVAAQLGAFWGPHKNDTGTMTDMIDLRNWDLPLLTDIYLQAARGVEADVFPPSISSMCKGCTVREYCAGWSGIAGRARLDQHLLDTAEAAA